MKQKRILLVEENISDVLSIQNALRQMGGGHSLQVAHSISEALEVLMGCSSAVRLENYLQTGKVRPDIVLLNISFLQQSAREFLEVINKYYSLKSIRVFVIGDSVQTVDQELATRYGIAGYLMKPLNLHDTLDESVLNFRQELARPGRALFALPLFAIQERLFAVFNFVKLHAGAIVVPTAAKVTAPVVVAACLVGAAAVAPHVNRPSLTQAGVSVTQPSKPAAEPKLLVMPAPVETVAEDVQVAPESESPATENAPAETVVNLEKPAVDKTVIAVVPATEYRIVAVEEPEEGQ